MSKKSFFLGLIIGVLVGGLIGYIEAGVGQTINLKTMAVVVNKSGEQTTLSARYGSPKAAKDGAKFVSVNLTLANTTTSEFTFRPDENIRLVDSIGREYETYSDSIGAVDDYLNYKDLSPSIDVSGSLIFEIPEDATSYYLLIAKEQSKEIYKVSLI
ncbi:MAG: hypothetical protein ACD_52C00175G0004 [uncultured bacterium]|uniref:DUF4352 domain-containing protein n=1 Tax=Candidatus Woesebacteria bacterium RIFCSPHIGHO2_12_FULL_41_24 TaxID=1802510 RepID=A0A1F8AT07_9BACT|nr:MAG: hypothetical protein ACD_52C00175G0004 [uncultured bacterium]OGM15068.1 MAG: hypothetical protein A2W15_04555 [Candidatus Woesebacteria bacterium RBG_16_41_13]OGM28980.1 MAG: hypothetical protein A2873_01510 [Candidatus Woesebacteria bacterium RIFCSPHIGHO2_01_FULL_42_80]OGM35148.1 MAG: hypothetical protein A3D84_02275 [Candidatus Woesebacteria bacterium RIFCSPHIGHO2_02_FULL_42_20]OGM54884.1 MAG: hypothetical protein A3E44_01875 [Candidatus Woesebacteria bacterium RIFCSPHIGHO2_12_FULL_41